MSYAEYQEDGDERGKGKQRTEQTKSIHMKWMLCFCFNSDRIQQERAEPQRDLVI